MAADPTTLTEDAAFSGSDPADSGPDPGRRTLGRLPANMLRGVTGLFSRATLTPLVVGGLGTGIASQMDDTVRDRLAVDDEDLSDFAADYLGPTVLGVAALGLMIGARTSDSPRFRPMTYDLVTATVSNLLVTGAMKAAAGRERPDGGDDDSFPSGHTSNAFALASVASAHYGKKVGIPAYAVASLIGISRLRSDAHWFSDVVAGATLGHLVGRAVVRQNEKRAKGDTVAGRTLRVYPYLGPSSRGVLVTATFP